MLTNTTIFGIPLDQSALEPVRALAQAIVDRDVDAAKALCVDGAWDAPGDSPKKFALQIARKRLRLTPGIVGRQHEGRATVRIFLSEEGSNQVLQAVFLLLKRVGGDWKIVAPTQSRPIIGLFLRGDLDLPATVEDLPAHEGAQAWAEETLQSLASGGMPASDGDHEAGSALEELARLAGPDATGVRIDATASLDERAAVRFGFEDRGDHAPDRLWVILDAKDPAQLHPIGTSPNLSLETLLRGLVIPWGEETLEEETPMTTENQDGNTPTDAPAEDTAGAKETSTEAKTPPENPAEMIQAFGNLVKGMAEAQARGESKAPTIKLKPGQGGALPEAMLNLFSAAIEQAKTQQTGGAPAAAAAPQAPKNDTPTSTEAETPEDDNVVNLDQERVKRAPRASTELEKKIQETLETAFKGYLAEHVVRDGQTQIQVDGEFLREHGPAVMAAMMQSIASALVPEKMEVNIPAKVAIQPDGGAGEEQKVQFKVDIGGMIQNFIPKTPGPKQDN